jgi:TolB-like protein
MVVLPFTSLSNDPDQQYFADALTEDLTTDLSRSAHTLVIPSGSVFKFKGKRVDANQIGRELGVRYVVEGSVQPSADRIRFNVQLIDCATDRYLWVERFDRDRADQFALLDEITTRIYWKIDGRLAAADAGHPTDEPDAVDYILRGRAAFGKWPVLDNYAEAIGLFERALALSPQSAEARSWLADVLSVRVLRRQADTPAADLARAEELIDQALALSPQSGKAHYVNM